MFNFLEKSEQQPKTPEQQPKTPEQQPKTPEQQPKTPEQQPKTPEQQPKTPEQQYKNLCEQLQYYRKKRNISQKNLAALTNTHAISRVERGYLRVRIDTFVKIVDGLGLDIILRPKDEIPF